MEDKSFQKKLEKIKKKGERQKAKYELEEQYAEYYPGKKRKVSNIMLAIIVVAIVLYTVANFWLTYVTGVAMDSTLTTCFYAFWGSELIALATLKTSKIIKGADITNSVDDCGDNEPFADDEEDTLG